MSSSNICIYSINQTEQNIQFPSYGSFKLIKPIGEGNFSQIFLARKMESDQNENSNDLNYAIKIFKKFQLERDDEGMEYPKEIVFTEICELHMLQRIKRIDESPYLVKILDWSIDRKDFHTNVLMESMPYDLRDYFANDAHYQQLDENLLKRIAYQILSGLSALHKKRIIHFDIKPENILFDPVKKLAKITDFTHSQYITYDSDKKNLECGGTYTYMPIEGLLKIKKYSFKYDIWSLGCILFELICRDIPFKGRDANKVFINILDFFGLNKNLVTNLNINGIKFEKSNVINYIKLHKKINFSNYKFYDLLQRMLCIDPDRRISADEALKHPYFLDICS